MLRPRAHSAPLAAGSPPAVRGPDPGSPCSPGREGAFWGPSEPGSRKERLEQAGGGGGDTRGPRPGGVSIHPSARCRRRRGAQAWPRSCERGAARPGRRIRLHLLRADRSRGSGFSAQGGLRPPLHAPCAGRPRLQAGPRRPGSLRADSEAGAAVQRRLPQGLGAPQPRAPPLSPRRALAAFELLTFCQLPSDEETKTNPFFPWAVRLFPFPGQKDGGGATTVGVGGARPGWDHRPPQCPPKLWVARGQPGRCPWFIPSCASFCPDSMSGGAGQ